MTDQRRQPIAVATPMIDPWLREKAELRVRHARWAQLTRELADARGELAVAIHAASVAGLSYRQIGVTISAPLVFTHRLYHEGKPA